MKVKMSMLPSVMSREFLRGLAGIEERKARNERLADVAQKICEAVFVAAKSGATKYKTIVEIWKDKSHSGIYGHNDDYVPFIRVYEADYHYLVGEVKCFFEDVKISLENMNDFNNECELVIDWS